MSRSLFIFNLPLYNFHILQINVHNRGTIILVIAPFIDFFLNTDAVWMISAIKIRVMYEKRKQFVITYYAKGSLGLPMSISNTFFNAFLEAPIPKSPPRNVVGPRARPARLFSYFFLVDNPIGERLYSFDFLGWFVYFVLRAKRDRLFMLPNSSPNSLRSCASTPMS